MKNIFLLIVVLLIASGYFSYKEGYLANFHPLLDPSTHEKDESENGENPTIDSSDERPQVVRTNEEGEEPQVASEKSDEEETSAPTPSKKEIAEAKAKEREIAKLEKAEKDRLAKEALAAEKEKRQAELMAAEEERNKHNTMVDQRVAALETKSSELTSQLRAAEKKMFDQEMKWRQERIKTRDADKQQLRDASAAFQENIKAQIETVRQQLRETRRQYK